MQKFIHKGIPIFKIQPIEMINQKVSELYNFTPQEEDIIDIMIDTLRAGKEVLGIDCVALAAPQIGWQKRVFISADLSKATKNNLIKKIEVFINPTLLKLSNNLVESEELCLSIPNKKASVLRSDMVQIQFYNLMGKELNLQANQQHAFIYQHEMDHLDGIDMLSRARSIVDI